MGRGLVVNRPGVAGDCRQLEAHIVYDMSYVVALIIPQGVGNVGQRPRRGNGGQGLRPFVA